ncbi:anti-sigma factor family protein [Acidicapsa ligni]|uniref:anti-sigma factor family protein n=1 Tax=Acidicapsa ligni TaxID=542300 RepID=UPI0021E08740|nr:zf-HC2 domain-containing protein [Acidicapsa ligni]
MKCAEIHEKVALAAYGELPDDQMHALAQHLVSCPECREEQEQLLALKTLAGAYPVIEPNANLVARSRTRLEEALDALPPKRWYDRVADWMTRTAAGLQNAPVAACLLLVAGAGLGSLGGYEYAAGRAANSVVAAASVRSDRPVAVAEPVVSPAAAATTRVSAAEISGVSNISNISKIVRQPNSNLVEVSYNQVEPRQVRGTLENPQIQQLLMLASQNAASPGVRDDSVGLLAAACKTGSGCQGADAQGTGIRDALMVALRYDRSATVREKALAGLEPYVSEDMQVRNAVLEALLNDPEAKIRSEAISMLQPVEADTSVRQVLSTVALSDQNSHIRTASRAVLQRVSEIQ